MLPPASSTGSLSLIAPAPGYPAIIAQSGMQAKEAFVDYFTASIRNKNTRAAYKRAVAQFLAWLDQEAGVQELTKIKAVHVAAYTQKLTDKLAAPTAKQALAAIRMLFDYLVVRQVIPNNPAHAVRGPRHSISQGKTIVLNAETAQLLLSSIDTSSLAGLRDRALIAVMLYSFARISAVLRMRVMDYHLRSGRRWLRLHEKGGKEHLVPCHHLTEQYLNAYIEEANMRDEPRSALFRSLSNAGSLTTRGLDRHNAYQMVRKHARRAGITEAIGCHSWRATGITVFLQNGGSLEAAQRIAAHSSPRTTKLYDRRGEAVELEEIERIDLASAMTAK